MVPLLFEANPYSEMLANTTMTVDVAKFIERSQLHSISEDAVHVGMRCMLDGMGVFVWGSGHKSTTIQAELAWSFRRRSSSRPGCTDPCDISGPVRSLPSGDGLGGLALRRCVKGRCAVGWWPRDPRFEGAPSPGILTRTIGVAGGRGVREAGLVLGVQDWMTPIDKESR